MSGLTLASLAFWKSRPADTPRAHGDWVSSRDTHRLKAHCRCRHYRQATAGAIIQLQLERRLGTEQTAHR